MARNTDGARAAYDRMAPYYDRFTAHHDYDAWTRTLERLARGHGLHGRRLLDVGCGTGKSFLAVPAPRLRRRRVRPLARDGGPAHGAGTGRAGARVRRARAAGPGPVRSRLLPRRLPQPPARRRARSHAPSAGCAANLAPGGVLAVRRQHARHLPVVLRCRRTGSAILRWQGRTAADAGRRHARPRRAPRRRRRTIAHVQRHHPEADVARRARRRRPALRRRLRPRARRRPARRARRACRHEGRVCRTATRRGGEHVLRIETLERPVESGASLQKGH